MTTQTHIQPMLDLINGVAPTPIAKPADIPRPTRIVEVNVKTQYGSVRFYPANDKAFSFLRIQGGRTLTQDTLKNIKDLGYHIKFNQEEIKI